MPVFEEKWISPLAVRFTQDHIRTTFRDGRLVESSIPEIQVRPAPVGSEYDVILQAPFPHVEIVRWRVGHEEGPDSETSHWFTLDNRRLYCLQRAAVALWPKRVAAVVEILYNDLGRMRRKFDSTTCGWSVSISHHLHSEELCRWDWRRNTPGMKEASLEVLANRAKAGSTESAVLERILDDDDKQTTQELASAPEEQGMLAAFFADADSTQVALPVVPRAAERSSSPSSEDCGPAARSTASTSSTCASNADSDSNRGEATKTKPASANKLLVGALKKLLDGTSWQGKQGEVITFQPKGHALWIAARTNATGSGMPNKKFTVSYDEDTGSLWWATRDSYYRTDASSLCKQPEKISWYGGSGCQSRPRFTWTRAAATPGVVGSGGA